MTMGVGLLDGPRKKWRRAGIDAAAAGGGPFTEKEVHQLAFGLPEQWAGIINRDRWRAHGAPVMDAWRNRLETEQLQYADAARHMSAAEVDAPRRSEPWPVAFYGQPDSRS